MYRRSRCRVKKYPIDPTRLGVTGGVRRVHDHVGHYTDKSFSRRCRRGRDRELAKYYGQNLIDQWMIPFFGASVYEIRRFMRRVRPFDFIKNVKTPTLVVVGERDAECPGSQSYETWHASRPSAYRRSSSSIPAKAICSSNPSIKSLDWSKH